MFVFEVGPVVFPIERSSQYLVIIINQALN